MAGNMNHLMAVRANIALTAANVDYTATRGMVITNVLTSTNVATGAETTTVLTRVAPAAGFVNVVTTALVNGVADLINYGDTLAAAQQTLATGDAIRFTPSANTYTADVFAYVIPTTWIAG